MTTGSSDKLSLLPPEISEREIMEYADGWSLFNLGRTGRRYASLTDAAARRFGDHLVANGSQLPEILENYYKDAKKQKKPKPTVGRDYQVFVDEEMGKSYLVKVDPVAGKATFIREFRFVA